MSARALFLAAVPFLLGAAELTKTAGDQIDDQAAYSHARALCHSSLEHVSKASHSDFEIAANCRARIPQDMCRRAKDMLGDRPWEPVRIFATCNQWEAERRSFVRRLAPARRTQDLHDISHVLEEVIRMKVAGSMVVNGSKGSLVPDMNSVVQRKAHVTRELEQTIEDKFKMWAHMGESYDSAAKQVGAPPLMPAHAAEGEATVDAHVAVHGSPMATMVGHAAAAMLEVLEAKWEQAGPRAGGSGRSLPVLCGAAVVVPLLGAAMGFALRRRRRLSTGGAPFLVPSEPSAAEVEHGSVVMVE